MATVHVVGAGLAGLACAVRLAREMLELAREGLRRRAVLDSSGHDESHFLDPLDTLVETGQTPADGLLKAYREEWNESVDPLYADCAY